MRVAVYSSKPYDRRYLDGGSRHSFQFIEARLTPETAGFAAGCQAVCAFVNDDLGAEVLGALAKSGVRFVVLRCAGFNNVDLKSALDLDVRVARVPAYSPHAVAEHTLALLLALNRKIHRAHNRVHEGNFSLDGLLGFDLYGKTAGVVGTGAIGEIVAKVLVSFGCTVLATDPVVSQQCVSAGVEYVSFDELCARSRIVTLHCPLTPDTHHLIDAQALTRMQNDTVIVNTSRGGVIDTRALIGALKRKTIGGVALDVYEEEGHLFFNDLSTEIIEDDVFARLLTFPNVLITGHQGFFTHEALTNIAEATLANLDGFAEFGHSKFEISVERVAPPRI